MGLQKAVECRPPQAVLGSSRPAARAAQRGPWLRTGSVPPPHQLQIFCNRIVQLHSSTQYYRQAWGGGGGEGGEKLHRAGVESCQVSLGTNNGTFCKKINTRCSGVFPTYSIKEQCHKILTTIFS